jgi:nucleoside-diphosphate-sugar epimerase
MKLLVTGANGFLGKHVVAVALESGHEVMAMIRPASSVPAEWHDQKGRGKYAGLKIVRADLRSLKGLTDSVRGADAVLHLAAAKSGDLYAQLAGTVVATENLLTAMNEAGILRIVHISTFSVYDYCNIRGTLDENSPLELRSDDRDDYAKTKLLQERMVRDFCSANEVAFTILRPGVVFGRGNEWTARLGFSFGKNWILTGLWAHLPLTYVDNCAEAIVIAAEAPEAAGETFNVVDDELPNQLEYARELQRYTLPRPRLVPVPWTVMKGLAWLATLWNTIFFRGRGKVPGILVPAKLYPRSKPLHYTNAKLRRILGWNPKIGWKEGLANCFKENSG